MIATLRLDGGLHQIKRQAIVSGLPGADVHAEKRRRFHGGEIWRAILGDRAVCRGREAESGAGEAGGINMHVPDAKVKRGRFYFGGKGTFLFCLDTLARSFQNRCLWWYPYGTGEKLWRTPSA